MRTTDFNDFLFVFSPCQYAKSAVKKFKKLIQLLMILVDSVLLNSQRIKYTGI